ncbi:MAG: DUF4136 domain-containing protein [Pseudomonadota bacterium]
MPTRLVLIACLAALGLLLGACQGRNPYSPSALPQPPAPAVSPHDRGAYPAAPRDYADYRTWAWYADQPPVDAAWVDIALLQDAVGAALDQRGLRPARDETGADLWVEAQVRIERRQRQVHDDYGYGQGGYSPYGTLGHGGVGIGASVPLVRTYEEEVVVVSLILHDALEGRPVWRGSAETRQPKRRGEHADALRAALRQALADYPPR